MNGTVEFLYRSHRGARLHAVSRANNLVSCWDLARPSTPARPTLVRSSKPWSVSLSPDRRTLLIGYQDGVLELVPVE
jgi:hypothetical protein